jgi:hypothetical protein
LKARLSATEVDAYLHGLNRQSAEELPLRKMADVHKILVDNFLAPLGLELEPHEFQAASGDTYVNFLLRPQALANYLVQDLGLAAQLMLEPPPQTRAAHDPLRVYGEHLDAEWFRRQQARLGPGVIILSMSAFMDGTVRRLASQGVPTTSPSCTSSTTCPRGRDSGLETSIMAASPALCKQRQMTDGSKALIPSRSRHGSNGREPRVRRPCCVR